MRQGSTLISSRSFVFLLTAVLTPCGSLSRSAVCFAQQCARLFMVVLVCFIVVVFLYFFCFVFLRFFCFFSFLRFFSLLVSLLLFYP